MYLQYFLTRFTLLWFFLITCHPLLKQFQHISLIYFHRCIQNTYTICGFLDPLLLTFTILLVPSPEQDLFYLPILHFLKHILIVKGIFALVFQTWIYRALIRLTPSITYSFSVTRSPVVQSLQCMAYTIFMHRCDVSIFFTLTCFFSLPPPVVLSERPTNGSLCYVCNS